VLPQKMKIYEVYLLCTFLSSATEKFFKKIFKITIDFLSWSIKVISVKRLLISVNYTAFKEINKEV
ncbi:hypothetical protein NH288_09370, partial [Anaerococcus sp. NML200537]|uniref:hypothetical protein n=1 Tax=Anaerococcus sp. NML200537 TaxID=2954485 RepID=UPI0022370A95